MNKGAWKDLHIILTTKGYTFEAAFMRFSLRIEELIYNSTENEYKLEVDRLIKELINDM